MHSSAADIAHALGGKKNERGWLVKCPAHDDQNPSLSITDGKSGKLLVKCWAGCDARDVLRALRKQGMLANKETTYGKKYPAKEKNRDPGQDAARIEVALGIWREAQPVAGTYAEMYLRGRGITVPPPPSLRYHPALKHCEGECWPCMVALVQRVDRQPIGIHRTFIAQDGARKAPVSPDKMMLGPCRGGAVRFAPASEILMVGEGIETCLTVMQATGLPTWVALSTSGLRALDLPAIVREITVLADNDDPGEQAAKTAALRWTREGRSVRIARSPRGKDFNDMLRSHVAGDAV